MVPVVEQFAGKVGKRVGRELIAQDLADARHLLGKRFYIGMNCDFRGRVYGIPTLNFQREDHVRSLFLFANGKPLTEGDLHWLEIHVANCGGEDKSDWITRLRWVENNRELIKAVADNPIDTVERWRHTDAPFSFVAGCMELAAAWTAIGAGERFLTHLPTSWDASCNGLQHLALMCRNEVTGALVNLTVTERPQDVYTKILDGVADRLRSDLPNPRARFWLGELDGKSGRKLIKRPAMTFAYSATVTGMRDQVRDAFRELNPDRRLPRFNARRGAAYYLAQIILDACKEALPREYAVMQFMRRCASVRLRHKKQLGGAAYLEWTSPSGFPFANLYYPPAVKVLSLRLKGYRFKLRVRVASGHLPELDGEKMRNAIAPNITHAMDAAYLALAILAAVRSGIVDFGVVHDSFACLAPDAQRFHTILREEFANIYSAHDVLGRLRAAALDGIAHTKRDLKDLELPPMGRLDLNALRKRLVRDAEGGGRWVVAEYTVA